MLLRLRGSSLALAAAVLAITVLGRSLARADTVPADAPTTVLAAVCAKTNIMMRLHGQPLT
jgi:hypothetical protein